MCLILSIVDNTKPVHPMPADIKDANEKYAYPKKFVMKAEPFLAHMMYRQHYKVHLVFSAAVLCTNFDLS